MKVPISSEQTSEHRAQTALPRTTPQTGLVGAAAPDGLGDRGTGVHDAGGREPGAREPGERGRAARKWLVAVVILAAIGAAVWKIRSNSQEQAATANRMAGAADRPTPVQVAAVEQKTMPIFVMALGTVTPYNSVTIKTRVDGQLLQVNVREGQAVRKGQLLVQIDPKPYEATLAQAQGNLVRDQATAANADAQSARYTALLNAGVVSKENQQTQLSVAGQAKGAIAADQATIQAARVNLGYTRIVSPIDGVVGLRQVDPGNIVHAADSTGLLLVTQLQPIAVIFTLPEDQLPQVQAVMRRGGKLAVDAYDRSEANRLATGTLLTLDNQIDTTTGTVKAKAVFDNRDGALFPNQFVNIRLILQDRPGAVVIPATALQTGSQGSFVYVVKEGQAPTDSASNGGSSAVAPMGGGGTRAKGAGAGGAGGATGPAYFVEVRPVKLDLTEGAQVIVASGLQPGEQVVVDGQEKLRNGAKVVPRVVPAAAGRGGTAGGATGGIGMTGRATQTGTAGSRSHSSAAGAPGSGKVGRSGGAPQ